MVVGRVTGYVARVRDALRLAFAEDHPPHLVATSFAVGLFVLTLPSLGAGVLLLAWIGYRFEWIHNFAFVAAGAVLNPLVKGGVYLASFAVGVWLLGPVPGATRADIGVDAGVEVLVRLFAGNAVLAVGFALLGYVVAYRTARTARRHGH
jgi:hypothetical protein